MKKILLLFILFTIFTSIFTSCQPCMVTENPSTQIKYTIKFDAGEGSGSMESLQCIYDRSADLPACTFTAPLDKHFILWDTTIDGVEQIFLDKENVKNLTKKNGAIITMTAIYVEKMEHVIVYHCDKPINNSKNLKIFKEYQDVTIFDVSTDHYNFDGWFDAENGGNKITGWTNGSIFEDVELWARWTPIKYAIHFDAGDGSGIMSDLICNYDESIDLPTCTFTAPTGLKFGYWNTQNDASGDSFSANATICNLTDDENGIILYAMWINKDAHSIEYHYDLPMQIEKEIDNSNNSRSYLESQDVVLQEPKAYPNMFEFLGWFDAQGNEVTGWTSGTKTEDISLTARFEYKTFTLKFDSNGGEGTMDDQTVNCYTDRYTIPKNVFTKQNNKFKGWDINNSATTVKYYNEGFINFRAEPDQVITLYAVWEDTFINDDDNFVINGEVIEYSRIASVFRLEQVIKCIDEKGAFNKSRKAIELKPYKLGCYPVTQKFFEAVMGVNPSQFDSSVATDIGETDTSYRPVEKVNWYQAIAFCNKLSLLIGKTPCYTVNGVTDWKGLAYINIPTTSNADWDNATCDWTANGYRLPTELEWEFAARDGGNNRMWEIVNDTTSDINARSWYNRNSNNHTWQVGLKKQNATFYEDFKGRTYNCYDMMGNVEEWCWDWYNKTLNMSTPITGAESGNFRVIRGGDWNNVISYCTSYARYYHEPYLESNYCGFRIASKN